MKACSAIERLKSLIFPRQKFGLKELVMGQEYSHHYFMRPTDDHQSNLMIRAHIARHNIDWEKGGFIFVSKKRAHDVLRILGDRGIKPKVVALSRAGDIDGLIKLHDPGAAWVFIEDDELPYDKRVAKMRALHSMLAQKLLMHFDMSHSKIAKPYIDKFTDKPARIPLMFIEVTLPFVAGSSVVYAQARSLGLSYCVVSRQSHYDHAIDLAFGGPDVSEEIRSIMANTIQIYGSGPRHWNEIMDRFDSAQKWKVQELNTSQGATIFPIADERPHELAETSNLGAYFCGSEMRIIDLEG